MKSFCIKTNNNAILEYLLDKLDYLELEEVKYSKNKFKIGEKYKFFGKVNIKSGKVMLNSPVFDIEENNKNTGRIIPIYPLTYNLSQSTLRKIMESAIEEVYGKLEETLPQYLLKEYNLENLNEANKTYTFPR